MNHLVHDDSGARRLHDLDVVVIERRQTGTGQPVGDAALLIASVEPRRVDRIIPTGCARLPSLALGGQRRNPTVGRVDDERGAVTVGDEAPGIGPPLGVIEPRGYLLGHSVHTPSSAVLDGLLFLFGVELACAELACAFERRHGSVVPRALQIGITPWSPEHLRRLRGCGGTGGGWLRLGPSDEARYPQC